MTSPDHSANKLKQPYSQDLVAPERSALMDILDFESVLATMTPDRIADALAGMIQDDELHSAVTSSLSALDEQLFKRVLTGLHLSVAKHGVTLEQLAFLADAEGCRRFYEPVYVRHCMGGANLRKAIEETHRSRGVSSFHHTKYVPFLLDPNCVAFACKNPTMVINALGIDLSPISHEQNALCTNMEGAMSSLTAPDETKTQWLEMVQALRSVVRAKETLNNSEGSADSAWLFP